MDRATIILINVVVVAILAFIYAYRQAAKGRQGWPDKRTVTILAGVSSVLLLLVVVFVNKWVSERPLSLEEKLRAWKPDASSAKKLDEYNRLLDVEITEVEAPKQYSLQFTPQPNRNYRYVSISSTYSDVMGERRLVSQVIEECNVATKRSGQAELLIEQEFKKLWSIAFGADESEVFPRSEPTLQLAVRGGDVYRARREGSGLNVEKSPVRGEARDRIAFDLPEEGKPQIDKSWSSVTKSESFESTMNHTLVGFATVQGILTAMFVSEGEKTLLLSPAFVKAAREASEAVARKMAERFSQRGIEVPEGLPPVDFSPPTIRNRIKTTTYVELATGLVVRREIEITSAGTDTTSQPDTITVVQRLASQ